MKEKFRPSSDTPRVNNSGDKKLNFEVSSAKAKTMMLLAGLSAVAPTFAKSTDSKDKKVVVADNPDQEGQNKDFFSDWKELSPAEAQKLINTETGEVPSDATSTSLSLEKVADLTDIIPSGAPEVFDNENTELYKREIMRNHVLKQRDGGNWSFFAFEVNGTKKIGIMTASHVDASAQGDVVYPGGDMFGFPTNGGLIAFEGIMRTTNIGLNIGDTDPTTMKFKVAEITKFRSIDGGELENPGPNDWKTIRTFPLASDTITPENAGYVMTSTQSGNWLAGPDPIPDYDPALAERFVSPVNLDPTGNQDVKTKLLGGGEGGKTITVPMQIFQKEVTNLGPYSSGGEMGQILASGITPEMLSDKNLNLEDTKKIIQNYRVLGPLQRLGSPNDNADGVLNANITLIQPYLEEIKQQLASQYGVNASDINFVDEALDMEVNGVGDVRVKGRVIDNITSIEEIDAPLPEGYKLEQNYPNPFNPTTKIRFEIPQSEKVTLKVYDILGREVETLINGEEMFTGTYDVDFNGAGLASGVYVYRLTAGKTTQTKKMILLR